MGVDGIRAGGGGGLHFRDPPDVFADEAARSTYFTTTDTTAYLDFVLNRSLSVIIGTLDNGTFWTYTGSTGVYDDSQWVERTDAVQGVPGAPGGGAIEEVGTFTASGTRTSMEFLDTGLAIGNAEFMAYQLNDGSGVARLPGMVWFHVGTLTTIVPASAGDTAVLTGTTQNALQMPETVGVAITSNLLGGHTAVAGGNLLLATVNADEDFYVVLFRYLHVVPQGLNEDMVNALIREFLANATTGNTETDIEVELDANDKLNFVVDSGGGGGGTPPPIVTPYERRVAVSADTTLTVAEVTAGTSSLTSTVRTPTWSDQRYIFVGVPTTESDISDISSGGIAVFSSYLSAPVVDGFKWWRTDATQDGQFSSNITYRITQ